MELWSGADAVPAGTGPTVITMGNFDGVHRGHLTVLARVRRAADALGARAVAVTFDPHPGHVHRPDTAPALITGLRDRVELLGAAGLDAVLVLEYSMEFARQSPERFVQRYLVELLGVTRVVVGRDVRFGWRNAGTIDTMIALGREHGFEVEVVDDVGGGDAARWSSTQLRAQLEAGDVTGAAAILGRWHRVRGVVVHGDARGRTIGFPTANLGAPVQGMVPADGVYAGTLRRADDGSVWPAAVSIGTNPTFDGAERRVEAYVLDRTDLDLYGVEVIVELVRRLRPMARYDGVDALVEQMHRDVAQAREVLGSPEERDSWAQAP
jgi:riboflavin kinase/FMN adenylyltransferase